MVRLIPIIAVISLLFIGSCDLMGEKTIVEREYIEVDISKIDTAANDGSFQWNSLPDTLSSTAMVRVSVGMVPLLRK